MKSLLLDTTGIDNFVKADDILALQPAVIAAHNLLTEKKGPGSEYLGWLDLPEIALAQVPEIRKAAERLKATSDALVVIGIGGSFLGSRAAIEAMGHSFYNLMGNATKVFFAGHNVSSSYHADLLDVLREMDFSVNIISKSGTTTEPAIAFRIIKELLESKYGREEAKKRIYATTDAQTGALRALAEQEGYTTFVIPRDIGGRYSVLTPVGLLPMAAAGIDINALLKGAMQAREDFLDPNLFSNCCYQYAAIRNILYRKGKAVELLVSYEPRLQYFCEWWKQLFGESEGKGGRGLFPATGLFSTDLHSLGQFIQEGTKLLFETVIKVTNPRRKMLIPREPGDLGQLNYLAGKDMDFVNDCAFRGTLKAHTEEGKVPNLVMTMEDMDEWNLGYLFYFMEKACAISATLLGVNPYDQPGVEAYKKNMFSLLRG
jgi:glucose-6-phosphate isomerase